MKKTEKMWYSIKEALEYLGIDERVLSRKMTFYNLESRELPGERGRFISRGDVLLIERGLKNPGSLMI